jgi:hypothetical protein
LLEGLESKHGPPESMGQDFAAVPASFAIGTGEKTQALGVHQTIPTEDSEFRFNFGFVETTGHLVTVRVRAFDGSGADQGFKDFNVREWRAFSPPAAARCRGSLRPTATLLQSPPTRASRAAGGALNGT